MTGDFIFELYHSKYSVRKNPFFSWEYEKMVKCFTDEERTLSSAEHTAKQAWKAKGDFQGKKCVQDEPTLHTSEFLFYFEPITDKPRVNIHTQKSAIQNELYNSLNPLHSIKNFWF